MKLLITHECAKYLVMPCEYLIRYEGYLVKFGKYMVMLSDEHKVSTFSPRNGYGQAYLDKRTKPVNLKHNTIKYRWVRFKERFSSNHDTRFLKIVIPFVFAWVSFQLWIYLL